MAPLPSQGIHIKHMRALVSQDILATELSLLKSLHGRKVVPGVGVPASSTDPMTPVRLTVSRGASGADEGTLMLQSADGSNHTTVTIPCRVVHEGVGTAPLATLASVVANCETPDVTLATVDLSDGRISLSSDPFEATLAKPVSAGAVDAQAWGTPAGMHHIETSTRAIRNAMKVLAFALPLYEDARTGLLITPTADAIDIVATNGHCLGLAKMAGSGAGPAIAVPKSVLDTLLSLSSGEDNRDVAIRYDDDGQLMHVRVSTADGLRRVVTRRKVVQFVDFARVIPKDEQLSLSFSMPTKDAVAAVKRVRMTATDQRPGITIALKDGKATLSSHADGYESAESVDVEGSGEARLKLDYRYLMPMLLGLEDARVNFNLYGDLQPVTVSTRDGGKFIFARMKL